MAWACRLAVPTEAEEAWGCSGEGVVDVFHEEYEVEGVGGGWFEFGDEVEVEVSGVGGFGVDEQASTADGGAEFGCSSGDVLDEAGAEAVSFVVGVDAAADEEGYGLGVAAGAFAEAGRGVAGGDGGHGPGVVGHDVVGLVGGGDDEDFGGACGVGLSGVLT